MCLLLSAPLPALAQTPDSAHRGSAGASNAVRTVKATRLDGTIHLDGHLNEPAWQTADVAKGFTQSYPNAGASPMSPTEVRVLYDNDALYVGIRMFDAHPDSVAAQLARRDATGIYSDWVHLMIDSYHDRRTAFRFSVNPRGVKKDVLQYNDNNEDLNWDAIWEVATSIDSLGWTAEYRIPFSQLRFGGVAPTTERVWGLQVMRDIARNGGRDVWSPWTPQSPGFVSSFGDLTGISGIPIPNRLEIVPYVSTQLTRAPGEPGNPFYRSNNSKLAGGADVKYGLPSGLTLTATINPDFGQVEVDPAVVNLSAFETFFPEKRPFFLEGSDIFAFGSVRRNNDYNSQQYFYSRRIGRSPQRFVNGSTVAYVDAPSQSNILGAAKVTGKTGGWTVGLLDALTGEQDARVFTTSGTSLTMPVEPRTNYSVGRLRRDFRGGNTVVGAMATSTDRALGDSTLNTLLRGHALSGGMDFEHAWSNRTWITSGFLSGSRVAGSESAIASTQRNSAHYFQRPDAAYLHYDPTRTSLSGHMGEIAIAKTGTWNGSLAAKDASPGFEINDLGFQPRVDYRSLASGFGYQSYKAGKLLRSWGGFGGTTSAWNYGGTSISQSAYAYGFSNFSNFWGASAFVGANPSYYSDRLTRGGPLVLVPSGWSYQLSANTDTRRFITIQPSLSGRRDASGTTDHYASLTLDMRPTSFIHVSAGPNWDVTHSTDQYVRSVTDSFARATYGRRYIFANLKQTTVAMDTRLDWTFTPTLSLQLYAQPFVSAGNYAQLKQLHAPRTHSFDVFGRDTGTLTESNGATQIDPDGAGPATNFTVGNPNFNIRSLRGDAVLRWEYRPGSALFFVWQQNRSGSVDSGDFEFSRDAGAIFRTPATNVFLVKATYWFGR